MRTSKCPPVRGFHTVPVDVLNLTDGAGGGLRRQHPVTRSRPHILPTRSLVHAAS